MTIELTHEQAAQLRYNFFTGPIDSAPEELWDLFAVNKFTDYIVDLSELGKAALAAYDAKWLTVPRDMFQSLVDDLRAEVDEHARRYAGYPHQIARRDDDRELVASADKILRGD